MPMNELERLPKWAQRRIEVAEIRVKEADERIRKVFGEPVDDRRGIFFQLTHDNPPVRFGIPEHTTIEFWPDGNRENRITVRLDGEDITIHTMTSMLVYPQASNAIQVRGERRRYT